jgi:hypothetical protein
MASAIGLRGYLITAHKKGDRALLPFNDKEFRVAPRPFVTKFVGSYTTAVKDDEGERSWYFEQLDEDGEGNTKGYTHYGTFGFESKLVDHTTNKSNYQRKVNDVEIIPLFYEFWSPKDKNFALAAFQSFQGRSCIGYVMKKLKEDFEAQNPGFILKYQKLLPSDGSSIYTSAPVKQLRLIKRNASSDITDKYLGNSKPKRVDFEVKLSAGRKGILGSYNDVTGALKKSDAGLVLHDGVEFSEAIAEVKIGGKFRSVGVFGSDSNAGVIDITEDIERGENGHPTFSSIIDQCDIILSDFYNVLTSKKS